MTFGEWQLLSFYYFRKYLLILYGAKFQLTTGVQSFSQISHGERRRLREG